MNFSLPKTKNQKPKTNLGFTLIELIIAITIFSIISLSIFGIYTNIIVANKKIELARVLNENSRNIMESLANEIRNKGIDYSRYGKNGIEHLDYSGSGNTQLFIKNGADYNTYCLTKDGKSCNNECYQNGVNCYLGKLGDDLKLSDERVFIRNLRFYISGQDSEKTTNEQNQGKATIVFDLEVAPAKGITSELAAETKMRLQTTISEKIYKN